MQNPGLCTGVFASFKVREERFGVVLDGPPQAAHYDHWHPYQEWHDLPHWFVRFVTGQRSRRLPRCDINL
jgi:hypothetical protein